MILRGILCLGLIGVILSSPTMLNGKKKEDLQNSRKTETMLQRLGNYETVIPILVDKNGNFLSYKVSQYDSRGRRRREATTHYNHSTVFYNISAFGQEFHFELRINKMLFSSAFTTGTFGDRGLESTSDMNQNCHYLGYSRKPHISTAAISNCFGLHGIFQTENEDYFVEPFWNDTRNGRGHTHIVYKMSSVKLPNDDAHCGVKDKKGGHSPKFIKRRNRKKQHKHRKNRRRGKRSAVSQEKNVETMVVADSIMVEYHGKMVIQSYVLSIMNVVAKLFHDASIGNAINIVVSRLVILEKDQSNLTLNHNARQSLDSFCKWQNMQNLTLGLDGKSHHHDNAVLLTGYDICTYKNEPCGTLGLAPVRGMCDGDRSCSINEDIGLATAFTITHELGHNFGMQHDGSGNDCGVSSGKPAGIMAAQLTKDTRPFNWSSCSRHYITEFIDSEKSSCLDNGPSIRVKHVDHRHTTEQRDPNEQCKLQFGSASSNCKPQIVCRELWCVNGKGECKTKSMPSAEGTKCPYSTTDKGWCYLGECRALDFQPEPVDGSWGKWSKWDACTRTCGGGIESSFRRCSDPEPRHGGKYCVGQRKRYRSCNIKSCPDNDKDFRELQCADFNTKPFRGRYYNWKPFSGTHDKPCALNCIADGFNFYTEQARKVIDGTRCYPDKLDMCINGKCLPVGCDGILGSNAVEDKCRVCKGDNSTCTTISGVFNKKLSAGDYQEVLKIPKGAVHIEVKESVLSENYLVTWHPVFICGGENPVTMYPGRNRRLSAALKNLSDTYYINGDWTIDWPRKFSVAGTVFHYERLDDEPEMIRSVGPITEDLVVMILVQEDNKGISYQYNHRKGEIIETSDTSAYAWEHANWTQCSRTCGRGVQKSLAVCVHRIKRTRAVHSICDQLSRPDDLVQPCNEGKCKPKWSISDWSLCSSTCGGGRKMRTVICVQFVSDVEKIILPNKECPNHKPHSTRECRPIDCPAMWFAKDWSNCSAECGVGTRSRNVLCMTGDRKKYLMEKKCDSSKKPHITESCLKRSCPGPKWQVKKWSKCSSKCGQGRTFRKVVCVNHKGERSSGCDPKRKPPQTRKCHSYCESKHLPQLECFDQDRAQFCPLVVKHRVCNRDYFFRMCCKSCTDARKAR